MPKSGKNVVTKMPEPKAVQPVRALSPFDEMEQMMEQFFNRRGWLSPFSLGRSWWPEDVPAPFEGRTPKVDVIDRDKEVVVKAELPGVKKEDLDVTISDNMLTIKACTKHEAEKEEGQYHRHELSSGEFVRSLRLPAEVDGPKAKANFKDGLLELTIPKMEAAKRHSVKID